MGTRAAKIKSHFIDQLGSGEFTEQIKENERKKLNRLKICRVTMSWIWEYRKPLIHKKGCQHFPSVFIPIYDFFKNFLETEHSMALGVVFNAEDKVQVGRKKWVGASLELIKRVRKRRGCIFQNLPVTWKSDNIFLETCTQLSIVQL